MAPTQAQADEMACEESDAAVSLDKDKIFHLLQNERRRKVLQFLEGTEGKIRMRDIAEQVAAWEHDTTLDALMSDQRQRVYIALYQSHLPKLDEAGVIEYNQSRGFVERKPVADQLTPFLDAQEDTDENAEGDADATNWPKYYLGTAGVSAGVLAVLAFTSAVPGIVAGFAVLTLFSLVTGANLVDEGTQ